MNGQIKSPDQLNGLMLGKGQSIQPIIEIITKKHHTVIEPFWSDDTIQAKQRLNLWHGQRNRGCNEFIFKFSNEILD